MSAEPFTIRKTGHSRRPWRIFSGDLLVDVEREDVQIHGTTMNMPVMGYDTKAEAVAAMGRIAARFYDLAVERRQDAA